MALGTCLTDLRDKRLISDAAYERLRPVYDELVLQYEGRYGRAAAESMATEKALALAEADAAYRKRQVLLQAGAQGAWAKRMEQELAARGPKGLRLAAEQFIVDMDGHRRAIRDQALQMVGEFLRQQHKTLLGKLRNPAEARDVLAEVMGQDTGNAGAKAMADAWRQTGEWLRSRFNAAGGHIAKSDAWHLPQRHDMAQVRDAGFEAWRDHLLADGVLDRARMIDRDTGEAFTDAKLEVILRDMWEAIATDGWSRNSPGQMFVGATANQRAAHRVLHFASADAWEAYARQFGGGGTVLDAMISHIEGMARDIAAMERMGPNPTATLRFQQDWTTKQVAQMKLTGKDGMKALDEAGAAGGHLQRLFDEFTGKAEVPERRRLALGFGIFRSQQVAAKLGGAVLSVGGDFGLMVHNARFNAIPAHKVMARYVSLLNPANTADRAQAARHVLMADQWADGHAGMWRTTGEEITSEGARLLASGVLRASGLVHHTDVARQAFAMEMAAHVTHMRTRSFGQLEPAFQRLLQRYGIGEARWDSLRAINPESWKGTDWLYPETVAKAGDQALADDFMRMLVTETDFAVPVPDLRTRAFITNLAPKGTWGGEIIRSSFLFKGFPLTILNLHARRMLAEGRSRGAVGGFVAAQLAMRYGVTLAVLTAIGGALSMQAKEIARGRDPRPMDDPRFIGAALLQGGGLGIVGDLLFSQTNRFGGGVADTMIGPAANVIDSAVDLTAGQAQRMLDDDPANNDQWKRTAARTIMSETPGMSLWYARLLVERTLGDAMQEWAYGEDYGARLDRVERQAEENGTAYWLGPDGEARAPDLANAFNGGILGAGDEPPPVVPLGQ